MSINRLSKGKLLYLDNEYSISSFQKNLLLTDFRKREKIIKINLPFIGISKYLCQLRLFVRLLRLEPRNAIRVDGVGFYLSFMGFLYLLLENEGIWTLSKDHKYRSGMNNPLALVSIQELSGFDNGILYGEYWGNPNKEKVNIIWKTEKKGWQIAYSFPAHTITHIHGIVPDYDRECIYIFTGDEDLESGIWIARDNFHSVEFLVYGSQQNRCCIGFPIKQGLLYATDTPLEQNHIYLLYLEGSKKGMIEKLHNIVGSCIYGTTILKDGEKNFIFSTTVEGDSRNHGLRRLFSRKCGPGIISKDIQCLAISENDLNNCRLVATFTKDWFPFVFQFGAVTFPSGSLSELIGTPVALEKYDGTTVSIDY